MMIVSVIVPILNVSIQTVSLGCFPVSSTSELLNYEWFPQYGRYNTNKFDVCQWVRFQPIGDGGIKVILKMADLARFHNLKKYARRTIN